MGKLFGTDGIRGIANESLDGKLAYRVGQAVAACLRQTPAKKYKVILGMDTRRSSSMLEHAMAAGLCAGGVDVIKVGVVPTPAVAYLSLRLQADAGVVISASHNPFWHNGIKIFSKDGFKLPDETEEEIETMILSGEELPVATRADIGTVVDGTDLVSLYEEYLISTVPEPHGKLKIAIDCANGAACTTAKHIFSRFGFDVTYLADAPDGVNINVNCGSTDLTLLADTVRQGKFHLGLAFDGDADRCLAVDENGNVIDGDQIMAICATDLQNRGKLKQNGFVVTVMSNIGLHKFAQGKGLRLPCAPVGDRYVLELMQKDGYNLGGEQSGHLIFLDHMTTGDGQLAGLQFLSILSGSGKTASQLAGMVRRYPQVLLNVEICGDNQRKQEICRHPSVTSAVEQTQRELNGEGRILLRPSGTEPLIRVMVEAGTEDTANQIARKIANTVENLQK